MKIRLWEFRSTKYTMGISPQKSFVDTLPLIPRHSEPKRETKERHIFSDYLEPVLDCITLFHSPRQAIIPLCFEMFWATVLLLSATECWQYFPMLVAKFTMPVYQQKETHNSATNSLNLSSSTIPVVDGETVKPLSFHQYREIRKLGILYPIVASLLFHQYAVYTPCP